MDIRVLDDYEIRGGELQWTVWQFKTVGEGDKEREDWVSTGNYFASLGHALDFIFERVPRERKADRVVLRTAMDELQEMKSDIQRAARRFEKGLGGD